MVDKNNKNYSGVLMFSLIGIAFIGGMFAGMVFQQQLLYLGDYNFTAHKLGIFK